MGELEKGNHEAPNNVQKFFYDASSIIILTIHGNWWEDFPSSWLGNYSQPPIRKLFISTLLFRVFLLLVACLGGRMIFETHPNHIRIYTFLQIITA